MGKVEEVPNKGLLAMLKAKKHTDLSFIVERQVVRAHRIVVASQSSYFESLLYGSMLESNYNQIELHDTPWEAFNLILTYMYSGQISGKVSMEVVLDLLVLADRYNFSLLKCFLEDILSCNINISNVLQFMCYADMYSAADLHKKCTEYVDSNAKKILVSESLLLVPREILKMLLLRDSFLAREIDIFEAVMRWQKCNGMDSQEIEDILKCVRLGEIPPEQLLGIVKPSGLFSTAEIERALESDQAIVVRQPRGRIDAKLNLFQSKVTSLEDCTNFTVTVDSDLFGNVDIPLACEQIFTLMHAAPATCSVILFRFSSLYIINHVTFAAWPLIWEDQFEVYGNETLNGSEIGNPYMYILDVSKNGTDWTTVIDHSICKCYFTQDLYFPRHAARLMRLRVTKAQEYLKVKFKACSLTDGEVPYVFYSGGSIAPIEEITPEYITNWDTTSGNVRCMLTLHQPYHISRVTLLLDGMEVCATHFGQIFVSVSLYNKSRAYRRVANVQHNFSDQLAVNFPARLVSIVSIHFVNYYDGTTGEVLFDLLRETRIGIARFRIVCCDT